jgi:hypothetical protein
MCVCVCVCVKFQVFIRKEKNCVKFWVQLEECVCLKFWVQLEEKEHVRF